MIGKNEGLYRFLSDLINSADLVRGYSYAQRSE